MRYMKGSSRLSLTEYDTPPETISLIGNNSRVTHYPIGHVPNCIPAPHDPTWCEDNGLPDLVNGPKNLKYGHISATAMADKWSETVQRYIHDPSFKFKDLQVVMHSKAFGVVGIKAT